MKTPHSLDETSPITGSAEGSADKEGAILNLAAADTSLPVSVIIPAYNAASTLPRAIASVLGQSAQAREIIVVDDGSTDGTWAEIERLRAAIRCPRLVAIRLTENAGASDARNAGWDVATQEYIAFLDADDAWHPRKLEVQYQWMSHDPDVMLSGHQCMVANSKQNDFAQFTDLSIRYFGLGRFLIANRLSTPTVMLKREVDFRFVKGKRYAEDYLLWMSIVAAHGPAAFIDWPLAFLFKAKYGAGGLSSHLWQNHIGVLDTFSRLRRERVISRSIWVVATVWAWIKYVRRILVQALFC